MDDGDSPLPSENPESLDLTGGTPAIVVDRKRLDSNVRAFMRQPSTPWITFNRSSRIDEKMELRDLLPKPMFPVEAFRPSEPAPAPVEHAEPSGLAVAADLVDEQPSIDLSVALPKTSISPLRRMGGMLLGGAAGVVVAALSINALSLQPKLAELPKPLKFAAVEAPLPVTNIPMAAPKPAPPPEPVALTGSGSSKLTRVTLTGRDHVWMNGKRLLGKGVRSYDVVCGMQQIAIGEKTDPKFVDLPCGGELQLGK